MLVYFADCGLCIVCAFVLEWYRIKIYRKNMVAEDFNALAEDLEKQELDVSNKIAT